MASDNGQQEHEPHGRETFLALILTVLVGGSAVIFLIFVSGGFFFWVIVIALGLALLGGFHYLLWGWWLDRNVQDERDELELEEQARERKTRRLPWERRW